MYPDDYIKLKSGIDSIRNHVFCETFNGEVAVRKACIVMYIAAAILTNQSELPAIKYDNFYLSSNIDFGEYSNLKHIRKMDMLAYKYLTEAIILLSSK